MIRTSPSAFSLTVAALAFLTAPVASAQLGTPSNDVACCSLTTSLANDALRGRDLQGDERFFMTEGAPPNIHFLIDSSGSMRELRHLRDSNHQAFFNSEPAPLDATFRGCTNSYIRADQVGRGWNHTLSYPPTDMGTGLGSDTGFPNLFQEARFYDYMSWGDSNNPTPRAESSADLVCKKLHPAWETSGPDALALAACNRCLRERGFYKKPGVLLADSSDAEVASKASNFVFSGKFLNFAPPKYVTLRKVLKEVIRDLRRVRAGYSTFDGTNGGKMGREQNPSCDQIARNASSFDSNRGSYINDINGIGFSGGTPVAEALFNIGQYFSSTNSVYTSTYGIPNSYLKNEYRNGSLTSQGRSWCWGCQTSSVIIITDGQPTGDDDLPKSRIRTINGGDTLCPDYDGDLVGDCSAAESSGIGDFLDDVAKFLNTKDLQVHTPVVIGDLNTAGLQTLNIYGIGMGMRSSLLRHATEGVGGGSYYEADTADGLRQAILDIIQNVQTRATAFAAASVSSLQLNRTGGSFLPRFRPARQGTRAAWQGFLYRFNLAQELVLGCNAAEAASPSGHPGDLNQDGDCDDVHLMDKPTVPGQPGDAVIEDDQGNFVKLRDTMEPAIPFWEAGNVLKPSAGPSQTWRTRNIYTIVDNGGPSGGPDGRIDSHDEPVAFTEDNVAVLREHLGLSSNPNTCNDLAVALGLASLTPNDCARTVIRYYRGADALNPDPAMRDYDRPFLLNDIFHSAPIEVEPLTDRVFCGFGNQCLQTLFEGATELEASSSGVDGEDAYDDARRLRGERDKIVLVGSNGGMLHAFHSGTVIGRDDDTQMPIYDEGTGIEQWAFIPPDLMPKLIGNMGRHAYFVDGSAMVRDVWIDGADSNPVDGRKQAGEFRTVAVVGEGPGGVHRFALDLTRLIGKSSDPRNPVYERPEEAGDFLWMWPQPCDADALLVGESSGNFAPKPPPIGPVAVADPTGPYEVNGTKAVEKWIVFVNGGYDQWMARGRLLAMLDIETGRPLWTFKYGDGKPNSNHLKFPMATPPSMMDIGNANSSAQDADLLFDTATVVDYGGNIWTVRFWDPGVKDTSVAGPVQPMTNWFAARSFEVHGASVDSVRQPFAQMTSNALQPDTGWLRTFVGSGDRHNLMDFPGNVCRLSNPSACARQGCMVNNTLTIERGGTTVLTAQHNFEDYLDRGAPISATAGTNACAGARINVTWNYGADNTCSMSESGSLEYVCSGSSATWSCNNTIDDWIQRRDTQTTLPTESPNRFYGIWSYGVSPERTFNTHDEAVEFDARRLTDNAAAPLDRRLVDVTNATADASGGSTLTAGSLSTGWYLRYGPLSERTGSSSTIIDGCVLWNSFEATGGGAVCATSGANIARFFQGQFVSGAPNCARSFFDVPGGTGGWERSMTRTVVAVPGDPTPVRVVYNGVGASTVVTMEAGRNRGDTVSDSKELMQSVYQLEVDRAGHDCRHEDGASCE